MAKLCIVENGVEYHSPYPNVIYLNNIMLFFLNGLVWMCFRQKQP
jgi:hypothetical protein